MKIRVARKVFDASLQKRHRSQTVKAAINRLKISNDHFKAIIARMATTTRAMEGIMMAFSLGSGDPKDGQG